MVTVICFATAAASLVPLSYGLTLAYKTIHLDGDELWAVHPEDVPATSATTYSPELLALLAKRRRAVEAELSALKE